MIKHKDRLILSELRRNGRCSITRLARQINSPRSTVFDKMKRIEKAGVTHKYTCLLDFNKIGYPIHVKVLLRGNPENKGKIQQELINSEQSNNVYKLGNEYDFLASFLFKNMAELHSYLENLQQKFELKKCDLYYVAEDLKREGFMNATYFQTNL